jgi:hypothetical protein
MSPLLSPSFARNFDAPDDGVEPFIEPLRLPMVVTVAAIAFGLVSSLPVVVAPIALGLNSAELLKLGDSAAKSSWLAPSKQETLLTQLPSSFTDALTPSLLADPLFSKILAAPSNFLAFAIVDSVLFFSDSDSWRLVAPQGRLAEESIEAESIPALCKAVLAHSHKILGHLGTAKTLAYA